MQKTALSRSAIYRKMNDDELPKPICLGERVFAWVEKEVDGRMFGEAMIDHLLSNNVAAQRSRRWKAGISILS